MLNYQRVLGIICSDDVVSFAGPEIWEDLCEIVEDVPDRATSGASGDPSKKDPWINELYPPNISQ